MASTAALAIVAGAVAPALLVVLWHILRVSWLPVVLLTEFLVLEALVHNVAVQACCLDLLQSVCCLQTTAPTWVRTRVLPLLGRPLRPLHHQRRADCAPRPTQPGHVPRSLPGRLPGSSRWTRGLWRVLIFTLAAPAAYPTRGWSGSLHGAGGRLGGRRFEPGAAPGAAAPGAVRFEAVALGPAAAPSLSQPAGGGLGRAAPPSCRPSPLRRVDGLESRRRTSSASHARLVGRCSLRSPSYLPTIPCVGTGGPHWDPRAVRPGDPHSLF